MAVIVLEPAVGITEGLACKSIAYGTVAIKVMSRLPLTPAPEDVMIAGPAVVDETDTLAVPVPSVVAVAVVAAPVNKPRVVEKVTGGPATGAPLFVQTSVSVCEALSATSVLAAGIVNAK